MKRMVLLLFISLGFISSPLFAEEALSPAADADIAPVPADAAAAQVTFHNTEISSDMQVDTKASETELRSDILMGLRQMYIHANMENLISYSAGTPETEEIGALVSSIVLHDFPEDSRGVAKGDWKLIFQFWEGSEVSSKKSFEFPLDKPDGLMEALEIQDFLKVFMSSVSAKSAEVKIEGPANIHEQFSLYLNSMIGEITQQNSDMIMKMTGSVAEEREKFRKQLEERYGASQEPAAPAPELPAVPEETLAPPSSETFPAKRVWPPVDDALPPSVAAEPSADLPVMDLSKPAGDALIQEEQAKLDLEKEMAQLAAEPLPKTEEQKRVEAMDQQWEQTQQARVMGAPEPPLQPIQPRAAAPEPVVEPAPAAPQPVVVKAKPVAPVPPAPAPVPEKNSKKKSKNKKEVSGKTPFHKPLGEYLQMAAEREKQRMNDKEYTKLSKKMGKLKSQLQAIGYYQLDAKERNAMEKEIRKELGLKLSSV